jgi:hypothetical protein
MCVVCGVGVGVFLCVSCVCVYVCEYTRVLWRTVAWMLLVMLLVMAMVPACGARHRLTARTIRSARFIALDAHPTLAGCRMSYECVCACACAAGGWGRQALGVAHR